MNRLLLAIPLLVYALFARAQGAQMSLVELIGKLQRQGYPIVYSSLLVHGQQHVQVERVDLDALRQALGVLGLALQDREGVWVITRAAAAPAAPEPVASDAVQPVLETVIVTGSLHRFPAAATGSTVHRFSPADMSLVPAAASDAMRVTLRLPGMSSVGISAKPQIRGGLPDELLVMQDGVELLEPFHLADYHSAYSSIDYHTIESLDVYTGGFPSRYGNRMSGVMDIRNQWRDDEYDTDIGVSSFANFVHTRGELGRQRPAHWLLSVRQGDLTGLADYIETVSGDPRYADAAARMSVELSDRMRLAFGAVHASDDILFKGEDERASSDIDTAYVWSGLELQVDPALHTQFTLSWLDFERHKKLTSIEEEESKGGFLNHQQRIQRLALRNDWSALRGATLLEFGWQAEYNRGDYRHSSRIDRGILGDILDTQRVVERDIVARPDGWSGGGYIQGEWALSPRLSLQPSLRWDFQDYYLRGAAQQQVSPRIGLAYDIDENTVARISAGRFYQPEGVQELQVLDGVTRFFTPQHADQVIAALEWHRGALELVAEVYYKRYGQQKGRFENVFNPFVLLPEMEPDRVALYPDRALARGLDVDATWRIAPSLAAQLRYSYMDAQDRLNGQWVDRRWSQAHTVNGGISWRYGSFSLSVAATWHSGWRSSVPPAFVAEGDAVQLESVLNNTGLRDYYSLDVSARKSWKIGRTMLQVYADISNITDRHNQAGVDFDVEEVAGGYQLLPDTEALLGRVPSVGVTLSF
ncbi:MAG: TonB-dependent receptor [Halioglobus sp.]|nr:TonB-dependent receptor [Halioglobus sp.]